MTDLTASYQRLLDQLSDLPAAEVIEIVTFPPAPSLEVFRLEDNCEGVIWHDDAGWSGCLKWDIGNTDFTGPYPSRIEVLRAVKENYRLSYRETTDID